LLPRPELLKVPKARVSIEQIGSRTIRGELNVFIILSKQVTYPAKLFNALEKIGESEFPKNIITPTLRRLRRRCRYQPWGTVLNHFLEVKNSLPYSQNPANEPYPESHACYMPYVSYPP
jgi:hypothetical protein